MNKTEMANKVLLTRDGLPRQAAYIPLVSESSFVCINVYKVDTNSTIRDPGMRCGDSVAPERYGSSKGRYTVHNGMFSKQDNLSGRRHDPLFLMWLQLNALASGGMTLQCQLCNSFVDSGAYAFDTFESSAHSTRFNERALEVVEQI